MHVFEEIILSDSPGLSDLSEDLNGGHRTSTPNMSKKRMGSAPELNFIRKQIEGSYFHLFQNYQNCLLTAMFY